MAGQPTATDNPPISAKSTKIIHALNNSRRIRGELEATMEFQKWLERLARLLEYGFHLPDGDGAKYIATAGVTCWREMFDGGLSPEDALEKEFAAARH